MTYRSALLFISIFITSTIAAQIELKWSEPILNTRASSIFDLSYVNNYAALDGGVFVVGSNHNGSGEELLVGRARFQGEGDRLDDYFIAKFNAEGEAIWAKKYTGRNAIYTSDVDNPRVVPCPDGGAYLLSFVHSVVSFGNETIGDFSNQPGLLIARINSLGNITSHAIIPSNTDNFEVSKLAANGDLLLMGKSEDGRLELGGFSHNSNITPFAFVSRIRPESGQIVWLQPIEPRLDWINVGTNYSLLETRTGDIVVTLNSAGYAWSISGCRPAGAIPHGFRIAKLGGGDGQLVWLRNVMSHGFGFLTGLIENAAGDLVFSGRAGGELIAENGENTFVNLDNCNEATGFTMKLKPNGKLFDVNYLYDGFIPDGITSFPNGDYALVGFNDGWLRQNTIERKNFAELRHYNAFDELIDVADIPAYRTPQSGSYYVSLSTSSVEERTVFLSGEYWGSNDPYQFESSPVISLEVAFVAKYSFTKPNEQEEQPSESLELSLFPNPTSGLLNLNVHNRSLSGWTITVVDVMGRTISERLFTVDRNQDNIDLSGLPTGVYQLLLTNGEERITRQIVLR